MCTFAVDGRPLPYQLAVKNVFPLGRIKSKNEDDQRLSSWQQSFCLSVTFPDNSVQQQNQRKKINYVTLSSADSAIQRAGERTDLLSAQHPNERTTQARTYTYARACKTSTQVTATIQSPPNQTQIICSHAIIRAQHGSQRGSHNVQPEHNIHTLTHDPH